LAATACVPREPAAGCADALRVARAGALSALAALLDAAPAPADAAPARASRPGMTVSGLRAAWGAAALAGFAAGLLALRAASARAPAFTATERETLPSLAVFS
jgi:hypothetical protein